MPWSLIASIIPFVIFIGFLVGFEHRSKKKLELRHMEAQKEIKPVAKLADKMHKKKFGRASTELNEVFPELKAVK